MGDWKRTIGFAVAIVAIGMSLIMPWWEIGDGSTGMSIKLRTIDVCYAGACEEYDTGGIYGMVSIATFFVGIAALLGLIVGGLLPALGNLPTRPAALVGTIMFLGFAVLTMGSIPDYVTELMGARKTLWYWGAITGPLVAIATPFAAMASGWKQGQGAPKLYRPPSVEELKRLAGDVPAPAPAVVPAAAPARAKPATMPAVKFAPAIPFALARAEIRDDLVIGVDANGRRRPMRWDELGGGIARELYGDPPFEATPMVDLIPRDEPPLRFVAATRLEYATGVSGPADPRDRLRRLLAFARSMNPELRFEDATAEFVATQEALPEWSLAELEAYDQRYPG